MSLSVKHLNLASTCLLVIWLSGTHTALWKRCLNRLASPKFPRKSVTLCWRSVPATSSSKRRPWWAPSPVACRFPKYNRFNSEQQFQHSTLHPIKALSYLNPATKHANKQRNGETCGKPADVFLKKQCGGREQRHQNEQQQPSILDFRWSLCQQEHQQLQPTPTSLQSWHNFVGKTTPSMLLAKAMSIRVKSEAAVATARKWHVWGIIGDNTWSFGFCHGSLGCFQSGARSKARRALQALRALRALRARVLQIGAFDVNPCLNFPIFGSNPVNKDVQMSDGFFCERTTMHLQYQLFQSTRCVDVADSGDEDFVTFAEPQHLGWSRLIEIEPTFHPTNSQEN